jgi:hypothetical protein
MANAADFFRTADLSLIPPEFVAGITPYNEIVDGWTPNGCPQYLWRRLRIKDFVKDAKDKDEFIDMVHGLINLMWPTPDQYKASPNRYPDPKMRKPLAADLLSIFYDVVTE